MEIIGALFFVLVFIGLGLFLRKKIHNSYSEEPDLSVAAEQEATVGHKAGDVIPFKDVLVEEFLTFPHVEDTVYERVVPTRNSGGDVNCIRFKSKLDNSITDAWISTDSETLVTIVSGENF